MLLDCTVVILSQDPLRQVCVRTQHFSCLEFLEFYSTISSQLQRLQHIEPAAYYPLLEEEWVLFHWLIPYFEL